MIALFDIGSTLIDGPPYGPARRLAEMLCLDKPAVATIEQLLFRTPSESPEHLGQHIAAGTGIDLDRAIEACTILWNAQLTEAYVLPGALEAVARLREANILRAYLSNIWPPFYAHFHNCFGSEADAPQFLSFQLGLSKPDKAFFHAALQKLNVPASQVVMIGDTYKNDILPAIELGMKTIWVLHRPEKETAALVDVLNGVAPRPDLTLHSIRDLQPEHIL
jgi:FMN phosphatase YigB (HAD superfamily)